MISAVCQNRTFGKVLEIGAGCGYQAAVLAQLVKEVHSVERVRGLYELARTHLRTLKLINRVRLSFGDGMKGLPDLAPLDRKSTRRTPVTNAHLVCRLLLEKKNETNNITTILPQQMMNKLIP